MTYEIQEVCTLQPTDTFALIKAVQRLNAQLHYSTTFSYKDC
jgi:hypothetical protein